MLGPRGRLALCAVAFVCAPLGCIANGVSSRTASASFAPLSSDYLLSVGEAFERQGRLADAARTYRIAQASDPQSGEVQQRLAALAPDRRKPDSATPVQVADVKLPPPAPPVEAAVPAQASLPDAVAATKPMVHAEEPAAVAATPVPAQAPDHTQTRQAEPAPPLLAFETNEVKPIAAPQPEAISHTGFAAEPVGTDTSGWRSRGAVAPVASSKTVRQPQRITITPSATPGTSPSSGANPFGIVIRPNANTAAQQEAAADRESVSP